MQRNTSYDKDGLNFRLVLCCKVQGQIQSSRKSLVVKELLYR